MENKDNLCLEEMISLPISSIKNIQIYMRQSINRTLSFEEQTMFYNSLQGLIDAHAIRKNKTVDLKDSTVEEKKIG